MDVPRASPPRSRRVLLLSIPIVAIGLCALGLSRLRPAAPVVDRSAVWVDTVRRGVLVQRVRGQGSLQPEHIRFITAVTSGRVEEIHARPGADVREDTILVTLASPELELQALEADRQAAAAAAELTNLQATLLGNRLQQESLVASLDNELGDAKRRAAADLELFRKGFLSDLEMSQSRDRAAERAGRITFERRRLRALSQSIAAQVAAQRSQLERLRDIATFRRRQVEAMRLRAGVRGVLQELSLQVGQWVAPGVLLAKVAQPERLKAELLIAETQAKDVRVGLQATIDTRNGVARGHIARIDPAVQGGTVKVDVALHGALPAGARPDLSVEGTIDIEELPDVLHVGRPAFGQPGATISMFKLTSDSHALRVDVQLGRGSAQSIEVTRGLAEGDEVILSDLPALGHVDRIRLQ